MPIISILVTLVVIGVVLYLINLIPMDATIRQVIRILVILLVCLWLISLFVPLSIPVGRYR